MRWMQLSAGVAGCLMAVGCGPLSSGEGSASEVAASVVSGAINGGNTQVGLNLPKPKKSAVRKVLESLSPIGTAWAASWTCTANGLSPAFNGPGSYQWTPPGCSVTWANGKAASSTWSGPFTLVYGASCDSTHPWIGDQAASCAVTRTTGTGGVTRTITGPNGGTYAIIHDTNGAGSGYDKSVTPAPSNGGVVMTCGAGGCAQGKGLVINGSHLHGTLTPPSGAQERVWDHTVSTGANGLTITGEGTSRVVNGVVTVQHNIAQYTATATFNAVGYGEAGCCFPTTGSISTTWVNAKQETKTESLSFSNVCGEASFTDSSGKASTLTLQHCL